MSPADDTQEDLTRKERREQARANRRAIEEAEAAGAVRRKRMVMLGSVVAVVVVAIVVVLVASGGSSSSKVPHTEAETSAAVTSVNETLAGTIQTGNTLGSANAPVTLQYFGDLECPICKDFTLGALPGVIQRWVRSGKLKIEYRSLETATREPEVFKLQQVAALAAGKQNQMWQYIELFYHEQGEESSGYVTEAYLQNLAKQVKGLNVAKWTSDRGNAALAKQVEEDGAAAANAGFNGTPAFLLGKTGGAAQKFEPASLTDPTAFNEAIQKLLKA